MLIQGCKREQTNEENQNQPPVDTNTVAMDTNAPPVVASNPPVVAPPPVVVQPPAKPPEPNMSWSRAIRLGKLPRRIGVTLRALEAANPGVDPTKLKVGQKLTIPAGGTAPAATGAAAAPDTGMGGETYTVKSGDTLTKIAKALRHNRQGD